GEDAQPAEQRARPGPNADFALLLLRHHRTTPSFRIPCDLPPHTHSQVFTGLLDVWHRAVHAGLRFFVVGARVPAEHPLRFVLPGASGEAGFARGRGLSGTALSGAKVAMARAAVASSEASVARLHLPPP